MSKTSSEKADSGRQLLKSTGIVAIFTMLSRILGLARDVTIATLFGAGVGTDAFFVAFKIPNFFRRLFAEGAFSQAFIPVLAEYKTRSASENRPELVRELVGNVSGSLATVLLGLTSLVVLASPLVVMVFAPGFWDQPEKQQLAADMLRITFPYLFFISLTAFASAILNSYGRFALPAFTPALLNLSLISAALLFTGYFPENRAAMALAWGVFIAGGAQLLLQLPALWRLQLLSRPRINFRHEGVRQILALMLPALFGVSVSQLNLLIDTVLASFLQTGSISWLYYSDRLVELPLGVFGIAIATVILPNLSQKHAEQSPEYYSRTLDWALRLVVLVGIPSSVALFLLAEPLITTLFYYNAFTSTDMTMSARSLMAYSIGTMAFMLVKVLATGYFSRKDMKTPVKIGVWALVVNLVLNLALIGPLAHAGLALATAVAAWVNAGLLFIGLRKSGIYKPDSEWIRFWLRMAVSVSVMAGIILFLAGDTAEWVEKDLYSRVIHMLAIVVAGAASYFASLWVLGARIRHFRA